MTEQIKENVLSKIDLIISLLVLSRGKKFTTDLQSISIALKSSLKGSPGRFPRLNFRIIDDTVYCDDLADTFDRLRICGMLTILNPMFKHYTIMDSVRHYFETEIRPNLSTEEITFLEGVARNVFKEELT